MCRNLRVKRELVKWRQEGKSYFSIVPLDVITFTLQYISPDIWKELFMMEKVWSWTNHSSIDQGKGCFLPDGSMVVGNRQSHFWIINSGVPVAPCLKIVSNYVTKLSPDLEEGYWFSWFNQVANSFTFKHHHPVAEKIKPCRSFPVPRSCWVVVPDFVFLENGMVYLLYSWTFTCNQRRSLLVRYLPDGSLDCQFYLQHEFNQLKYQSGKLFLLLYQARYQINHPTSSVAELEQQLGPSGDNHHLSGWTGTTLELLYCIPGIHLASDFLGEDGHDIFYLTESKHVGVYLINEEWDERDILLWSFPDDIKGMKFTLTSSGEILVLAHSRKEFILFRLY